MGSLENVEAVNLRQTQPWVLPSTNKDYWPWETYVDRYMVENKAGTGEAYPLKGYERAWSLIERGFIYEARIPFNNFYNDQLPKFSPTKGIKIGFDVVVNDVDITCPTSPCPSMAWVGDETIKISPSGWGTLIFESKEVECPS